MAGRDVQARIRGVGERGGGIVVRVVLGFVRRNMRKLVGRNEVPAPFSLFAHSPQVLMAYGQLERAVFNAKASPLDIRELARARVSTLVGCRW